MVLLVMASMLFVVQSLSPPPSRLVGTLGVELKKRVAIVGAGVSGLHLNCERTF